MELHKNASNVFMYVILSLHLGMLFIVSLCLGRLSLYLQNRYIFSFIHRLADSIGIKD